MNTQTASRPVSSSTDLVTVSGRFDAHMAPDVSTALDQRMAAGHKTIFVDLSNAHFVDSTALAVLVRGMKRTREQGGDLILCALQAPVQIIFELTRMDRAFTIADSLDAALAKDGKEIAQG
jgi:anti-sigma B factor antagonist